LLLLNISRTTYVAQDSEDVIIHKSRVDAQQENKHVTEEATKQNDIVDHGRRHTNNSDEE
jgi:hypothetical protein